MENIKCVKCGSKNWNIMRLETQKSFYESKNGKVELIQHEPQTGQIEYFECRDCSCESFISE